MLREGMKAWSNGSETYSSDPEEEEEEEMVFGEEEHKEATEMMDVSDLPSALFACGVHQAVFEEEPQRVRQAAKSLPVCVCVCV